jgi:hypothetical protein
MCIAHTWNPTDMTLVTSTTKLCAADERTANNSAASCKLRGINMLKAGVNAVSQRNTAM